MLFAGCPTFCILVIQPHVMLVNQPCVCRLSNLLVSLGSPTLCFVGYPTFTMCVRYVCRLSNLWCLYSRLSNLVLCLCCVWHFTFPFPRFCYYPQFLCIIPPIFPFILQSLVCSSHFPRCLSLLGGAFRTCFVLHSYPTVCEMPVCCVCVSVCGTYLIFTHPCLELLVLSPAT